MKRIACIILLFSACLLAGAQTRTYTDNANNTFVVGLQSYFYGDSGSLGIQIGARMVTVRLSDGSVWAGDHLLEEGEGQTVIGTNDFSGDREPELVVARRKGKALSVKVYRLSGREWVCMGQIGAEGDGLRDVRVFRQAMTIRNYATGVLYTWTWRGGRFDFKSSDGSPEP